MLPDMAKLDNGKCMLTRTLSLLLSLALRRELEEGTPTKPPSTPYPGRHQPSRDGLPPPCPPEPPHNGHGHGHEPKADGTNEKNLALQPPPPGNKKDSEKKKPTGDQGPAPGGKKQTGEGTDAEGGEETPPPGATPPTGQGEGEVEGGPEQGPNLAPSQGRDLEGLLPGVASRLLRWEHQFDQLVDDIMTDLKGYWMRLKTPQ